MLIWEILFVVSCYLLPISWSKQSFCKGFVQTEVPWERQSYTNMSRIRDSIGAAIALLASASLPSSSWCGLGLRADWASFLRGTCTRVPGFCSRSIRTHGSNSTATRSSGSLGGLFYQQWSAHSIALTYPCGSLKGLPFETHNKHVLRSDGKYQALECTLYCMLEEPLWDKRAISRSAKSCNSLNTKSMGM